MVQQYLIPQFEPTTKKDVMMYERDLLSFSITHPSKWEQAQTGDKILYEGTIRNYRGHTTKGNHQMAFFDLEFDGGIVDVVVFPKRFYKYRENLENNKDIKILGEKTENNSLKLIGVK
jgi:DNA polymerase III alpha subunit